MEEFGNVVFAVIAVFILGMVVHSSLGHSCRRFLVKLFHPEKFEKEHSGVKKMEENKKGRIVTKFGEVTEADYRGILAILLVLGAVIMGVITIWSGRLDAFTTVMAVFGPLVTLAVRDYFKSRE